MTDAARTNTADMYAVHGAFRTVLPEGQALVDAAGDDPGRASSVANFYDNVLDFLHVHHTGEDELIWPRLLERCPAEAAEVQRIAAQHDEVTELLAEARSRLAAWAQSNAASDGRAAGESLAALEAALRPHLEEEEQRILPLCSEHMSAEEWAQLPVHGFSHFAGDKPWVILGLIMDQLTDDQRAEMLAHMPPPARDMWEGFGSAAYAELKASLRAGVTP
jgi:iron-sulfur cluster repair protein YtfE (RIC family)